MSRIGKLPITVPAGVDVALSGQHVKVKGKLGELEFTAVDDVAVTMDGNVITVKPRTEHKRAFAMWATTRTMIWNMVAGVSEGFTRNLEINGVGYRAAVEGRDLVLQLGYSHPVRYPIPDGVQVRCERPTAIEIKGYDKQRIGQMASEIRGWRPPEPFKGKGVKYAEETILRKEGKKK